MARNLIVGERVYVPASAFENGAKASSALVHGPVLAIENRSVRVEHHGESKLVAASKCHRNIGLLIFRIGDLETETGLLDPLSKSVLQFCRLLVPDDQVHLYNIRSITELQKIWAQNHGAYSHVILIGHGDGRALKFATDGWQTAAQLSPAIDIDGAQQKCIINLACKAGLQALAKGFSEMKMCESYLGAFHSVQGAIASQFVQTFLIHHLLQGESIKVAFRHARNQVAGGTSFRLWRYGKMTTDT